MTVKCFPAKRHCQLPLVERSIRHKGLVDIGNQLRWLNSKLNNLNSCPLRLLWLKQHSKDTLLTHGSTHLQALSYLDCHRSRSPFWSQLLSPPTAVTHSMVNWVCSDLWLSSTPFNALSSKHNTQEQYTLLLTCNSLVSHPLPTVHAQVTNIVQLYKGSCDYNVLGIYVT